MAAIEKKPIKITETVLRDAHQSLYRYSYDYRADASDCGKEWTKLDIIL